jgi:hypothetical protein
MFWYFLIGSVLTIWTLLLLMAGERQYRLNEMETKRRNEAIAVEKKRRHDAQIPFVG